METMTKETNDLGYCEVDAAKFKPMGDRILLQWEHHPDELTVGKVSLLRPDTFKKQKYTGIVLSVGPKVDPEIKPGMRLIFDQFSDFQKFFDKQLGRLALIDESKQGSCFAIIPLRAKIGEGEGDYNYDA